MQESRSEDAVSPAAPAYVIKWTYSFETALDAGRFLQARTLFWYSLALVTGLLVGAVVTFYNVFVGVWIASTCILLLLMARFAVIDRLFGRRKLRSVIGLSAELMFSDDGIAFRGPHATGHIPWASITEVRANERTVLFVRDRLLVTYAPAEAFASARQKDEVIAYSRSRIEAAMAGRRPTPRG